MWQSVSLCMLAVLDYRRSLKVDLACRRYYAFYWTNAPSRMFRSPSIQFGERIGGDHKDHIFLMPTIQG